MKLLFCADIHLDHTDNPDDFFTILQKSNCDGILLGGDLSIAAKVCQQLQAIAERVNRPVYFVLGNHDYYGGSIWQVRKEIKKISHDCCNLFYLSDTGIIKLSKNTALIGHDSWGDGLSGDFSNVHNVWCDDLQAEQLDIPDGEVVAGNIKEDPEYAAPDDMDYYPDNTNCQNIGFRLE